MAPPRARYTQTPPTLDRHALRLVVTEIAAIAAAWEANRYRDPDTRNADEHFLRSMLALAEKHEDQTPLAHVTVGSKKHRITLSDVQRVPLRRAIGRLWKQHRAGALSADALVDAIAVRAKMLDYDVEGRLRAELRSSIGVFDPLVWAKENVARVKPDVATYLVGVITGRSGGTVRQADRLAAEMPNGYLDLQVHARGGVVDRADVLEYIARCIGVDDATARAIAGMLPERQEVIAAERPER
jgi:hypothetical protein